MFITLKCPTGRGNGNSDLEQVALHNALPSDDQTPSRLRLGRRPACVSCQTKKLRCTGRIGDCDGCRARSIACLSSSSTMSKSRKSNQSRSAVSVSATANATTIATASARHVRRRSRSHSHSHSQSKSNSNSPSQLLAPPADTDESGRVGDTVPGVFDHDISTVLREMEEFAQNHPQVDMNTGVDAYPLPDVNFFDEMQPPSLAIAGASALPKTNSGLVESDPPNIGHSHSSSTSTSTSTPDSGSRSKLQTTTPASCTSNCLDNTARVVQQLDDDDFRITTMSLAQVCQLQKWILTQCYRPLSCTACRNSPTIHTVLMVVCDRLAEMFECIHKRIRRANALLSATAVNNGISDTDVNINLDISAIANPPSPDPPISETREQLFCATSHRPAARAACNPELFTSDFTTIYSSEEQFHMIRVLLKLQVRNFRALLNRMASVSASQFVDARRSKLEVLNGRLVRAATEIDQALQGALRVFVVGVGVGGM